MVYGGGYGYAKPTGSSSWGIQSQQMAFGQREQANQYEVARGGTIGGTIAGAPKAYLEAQDMVQQMSIRAQTARANLMQEELRRRKMQMDLDMADRLSQSDVMDSQAMLIKEQARAAQLQNDEVQYRLDQTKRGEMSAQDRGQIFKAIIERGTTISSGGIVAGDFIYTPSPSGGFEAKMATDEQKKEAAQLFEQTGPRAEASRQREKHAMTMEEIKFRTEAAKEEGIATRQSRMEIQERRIEAEREKIKLDLEAKKAELEADKALNAEKRKAELERITAAADEKIRVLERQAEIQEPETKRKASIEERRTQVLERRLDLDTKIKEGMLKLEEEKTANKPITYNQKLVDSANETIKSMLAEETNEGTWLGDPAKERFLRRTQTRINSIATQMAATATTPENRAQRIKDAEQITQLANNIFDEKKIQGAIFAQSLIDEPTEAASFGLDPANNQVHHAFAEQLGSLYESEYRAELEGVRILRSNPDPNAEPSEDDDLSDFEVARKRLYRQIRANWQNPSRRARDSAKVLYGLGANRAQTIDMLKEELPGLTQEELEGIVDSAYANPR